MKNCVKKTELQDGIFVFIEYSAIVDCIILSLSNSKY